MTDNGAAFQPSADEVTVPFRPRSEYTGYRAFGSGDGAVLLAPSVAHELRSAAELATREGRIAGGLLYGRGWADEAGVYLVIDHYLEAPPGESGGGRAAGDDDGDFTLAEADLRLLRDRAAGAHSDSLEAGWWRSRTELGEFGPRDLATQGDLVGPDGVGLLVYGSGIYWGTAYLGPDGHAPDSAGTLAAVADPESGPTTAPAPPEPAPPEPAPPAPGVEPAPEAGFGPDAELADIVAGEGLEEEPILAGSAPRRSRAGQRTMASGRRAAASGRRMAAYGRQAVRRRGAGGAEGAEAEPGAELPADAQLVIGALLIVVVAAAIIIGFLASSVLVAVIIGAIGVLVVMSAVWMSHRY